MATSEPSSPQDPIEFLHSHATLRCEQRNFIRHWLGQSVNSTRPHFRYYRMFAGPDIDIEKDLAGLSDCFQHDHSITDSTALKADQAYSRNSLRVIWRFLKRRHAHDEAAKVARILNQVREPAAWRVWRLKECIMPRVLLAVFTGFLILSSSGDLSRFLFKASSKPHFYAILLASVAFVYLLALVEIQRLVGWLEFKRIRRRAFRLTLFGFAYGAIGAAIQYFVVRTLHDSELQVTVPFAGLCGAAAVVLGFVFLPYWQESSSADPL